MALQKYNEDPIKFELDMKHYIEKHFHSHSFKLKKVDLHLMVDFKYNHEKKEFELVEYDKDEQKCEDDNKVARNPDLDCSS